MHLSGKCCFALLCASTGISLRLYFIGRGVAIGPNILWSTHFPCPGIHLRSFIEGVPWMLGRVVLNRHLLLQVECVLHCTPSREQYTDKTPCID